MCGSYHREPLISSMFITFISPLPLNSTWCIAWSLPYIQVHLQFLMDYRYLLMEIRLVNLSTH
ncbi:hypothetical protein BJV82DRAFT_636330 [Fennellomyces sp. T-0311]|nr:hypothetical protein BJV82DRAFT_636330 [Fennellomyces sp. T-0311]